ncbi:hypothetical protein predicted by Glimmer/Critica [Acetobacter ghanensis]|uniref:Uncharacterized protein n=1 Tax=Acetobacter ghanensis TaxID=431306 RepID=A0A0U5F7K4_9PROT|nr:hypothetical protein predicted by Glimmer/Critica [Acetobacter ghanensis]
MKTGYARNPVKAVAVVAYAKDACDATRFAASKT